MNMLLADTVWTWKQLALRVEWAKGWVGQLLDILSQVLWVAMALVGAAGAIYAVYVGIKMARADSAEQREENKKRLINIIVTIVVVLVLILVFNIGIPAIISSIDAFNVPAEKGGSTQAIKTALTYFLHI